MARYCCEPTQTCRTIVQKGRCAQHQKPAWSRDQAPKRIRGPELQQLRAELFAREPLCRPCVKDGRVRAATIRDHIVPLAEGGTEDTANIQPICHDCHKAKTIEESMRGRRRQVSGRPWQNQTKWRRVLAGVCAACGHRPAVQGRTQCDDCLAFERRREALSRGVGVGG